MLDVGRKMQNRCCRPEPQSLHREGAGVRDHKILCVLCDFAVHLPSSPISQEEAEAVGKFHGNGGHELAIERFAALPGWFECSLQPLDLGDDGITPLGAVFWSS